MGRKTWIKTPNQEVKTSQIQKSSKHHNLCCLVAQKFFKRDFCKFGMYNTRYVAVELNVTFGGECPDVFGFGGSYSHLFEIKLSHSDFKKDQKKWARQDDNGIGEYRTYVCPVGIIKEEELPPMWGLLYYDENSSIFECVKKPDRFDITSSFGELSLVSSIMRRENIKPQVFNYRYTNNTIKKK